MDETLLLTLNKADFEVMITGEKIVEYRKRTKCFLSRVYRNGKFRDYKFVKFVNGYGANRPYFIAKFRSFGRSNINHSIRFSNGLTVEVEKDDVLIYLGEITERGNMKAKVYKIGIDPGCNTGHAEIMQRDYKTLKLKTWTFWDSINRIKAVSDHCKAHNMKVGREYDLKLKVYVENPNGNKPTFEGKIRNLRQRGNYLAQGGTIRADKQFSSDLNVSLKISQDVGRNKRDAALIIEYVKSLGDEVIPVVPTASKIAAKMFEQITGYKGGSQHARDAAKLVL